MVTANDVLQAIDNVDAVVLPKCKEYDDFEYGHPVYRIGDYGYIDADEFDGIIKGYGIPWLMNAYVYVGNGLLVDDAVDAVNNGDDTLDDFMATVDVDRLDEVYYTEI